MNAAIRRDSVDITLNQYGPDGKGGVPTVDEYALYYKNYTGQSSRGYATPRSYIHLDMRTPTGVHGESSIRCTLPSFSGIRTPEEGDRVEEGQQVSLLVKNPLQRSWPVTALVGSLQEGEPEEIHWFTQVCTDIEEARRVVEALAVDIGLNNSDGGLLGGTAEVQLLALMTDYRACVDAAEVQRRERMHPVARALSDLLRRIGL